jgi:predicted nucleic-acid-binding Zn-ribbon protein
VYLPLDKHQLQIIKSGISSLSVITIAFSARQLLTLSDVQNNDYQMIPLTGLQYKMIYQAKEAKSECIIQFNLHQLVEYSKVNDDIELDIVDKNITLQSKKRIFKF